MKQKPLLSAVLLTLIILAAVSCASAPKDSGSIDPQTDAPQSAGDLRETPVIESPLQIPEETQIVEVLPQALEETPVIESSPQIPEEAPIAELSEPVIDLPETGTAAVPPKEDVAAGTLPEPEVPVLALQPESMPLPPESIPLPPSIPSPEPPAESPPPVPIPVPIPPPPAFLGPAETERPPVIVHEPVPVQPASEPLEQLRPIPTPQKTSTDEEIIFSRTVRATVGQLVEIPFRGSGWVFLGEQGARRGIVYDSRRLDSEGQSFIFRTEAAGTYALKFYRQDFVQDVILNDYVQVIVGEAPETAGTGWFNPAVDRGRVIAEPRWPGSFEEAQAISGGGRPQPDETQPGSPIETAAGNEGVVPVRPPIPAGEAAIPSAEPVSEDILEKAREEFDTGRITQAISLLDQFRAFYPSGSDEAWWLYGQFYEANSPSRDILKALEYYRRLVREYPQSRYYNDARRRIAYLERYYINIQ